MDAVSEEKTDAKIVLLRHAVYKMSASPVGCLGPVQLAWYVRPPERTLPG
jgi:hypothetical protein